MKKVNAIKILIQAEKDGWIAYKVMNPRPMGVVQHAEPFNDSSPVVNEWTVNEGVCGFAWINVPGNSWFIRELKKTGFASADINCFDRKVVFKRDDYAGGYKYWVGGGQSYERKCAFASAFSNVLSSYGIKNYTGSRLD